MLDGDIYYNNCLGKSPHSVHPFPVMYFSFLFRLSVGQNSICKGNEPQHLVANNAKRNRLRRCRLGCSLAGNFILVSATPRHGTPTPLCGIKNLQRRVRCKWKRRTAASRHKRNRRPSCVFRLPFSRHYQTWFGTLLRTTAEWSGCLATIAKDRCCRDAIWSATISRCSSANSLQSSVRFIT